MEYNEKHKEAWISRLEEARKGIFEEDIKKMVNDYPENFVRWNFRGEDEGKEGIGQGGPWCIGPIVVHRGSSALDRSNYQVLMRELKELEGLGLISTEDYSFDEVSHWAVGHATHFSFRVVNEDGSPTNVMAYWTWHENEMEDYPIRDESLYSEMEEEAIRDTLKMLFESEVREDAGDQWHYELASAGWDASTIEPYDDYPIINEEWCRDWLVEAGYITEEEGKEDEE